MWLDPAAVDALLTQGARPDTCPRLRTDPVKEPLITAAEMVLILTGHRPRVVPLVSATSYHDYGEGEDHVCRIARALLARGADVNAQDGTGQTALMSASAAGYTRAMLLLLQHGADADARDARELTALHHAALGLTHSLPHPGDAKPFRLLLTHGASPALRDASGQTPEDIARRANRPAIAARLRATANRASTP